MTFPEWLLFTRKAAGLQQSELAAKAGLVQSRISKWELGEGQPGPTEIYKVFDALGVPLAEMGEKLKSFADAKDAEENRRF